MKYFAFGIAIALLTACAAEKKPEPRSPQPVVESKEPKKAPSEKSESVPRDWSTVESFTVENEEPAPSKRKGQVVVTSDAAKHGEQLHFNFWVNQVRIDGVFGMSGGGTFTFSIPAGAVEFSTDECSLGAQAFELAPGESMPVRCELGTEGDCCEVKIPDDPKDKK
jgi:hypothetical protein